MAAVSASLQWFPLLYPLLSLLQAGLTLAITALSRENRVRETRKSCSSPAPVGYGRFHKLSHPTHCSNALQLSDPYCSRLYCTGGFDVSAIAELWSGKERPLPPPSWSCFPASSVSVFTALSLFSQARLTPRSPPHSLCIAHVTGHLQTLIQQEFPFQLLAFDSFLSINHYKVCLPLGAIAAGVGAAASSQTAGNLHTVCSAPCSKWCTRAPCTGGRCSGKQKHSHSPVQCVRIPNINLEESHSSGDPAVRLSWRIHFSVYIHQ